VLVELKLVEQRYRAVIDVLDGMSVTDVAARNKVSRQTVHTWLRRPAAVPDFCLLLAQAPCPRSCDHPYTPRPVRHFRDARSTPIARSQEPL
jgi:Homeodomain-like domain